MDPCWGRKQLKWPQGALYTCTYADVQYSSVNLPCTWDSLETV